MIAKRKLMGLLPRLHQDEQGDEGVNKVLIIALIAIPLLVLLIMFGGRAGDEFVEKNKQFKQHKTDVPMSLDPTTTPPPGG